MTQLAGSAKDESDRLCWEVVDFQVSPPPQLWSGAHARPRNYCELETATLRYDAVVTDQDAMPWTWPAFEYAWSDFRHEFFCWRRKEFFHAPPPPTFDMLYQVILAGSAEYLCNRYRLEKPDWIEDSQYRMPTLCDGWGFSLPEDALRRHHLVQRSAPEFLKRNMVFESRNLITL